ncbi:hypothetical protein E2C01_085157 [Portunus trituberculatus]|uniref:Uncharacterized protein n=1 Tax=Portunus trituberculatus TaxID=210409 RepID=A0A5B7JCT9_PORTR|nr:hypothetical protein [Portunus trituberculatus]
MVLLLPSTRPQCESRVMVQQGTVPSPPAKVTRQADGVAWRGVVWVVKEACVYCWYMCCLM